MFLRMACNHCTTAMKCRVKRQEIAGALEDPRGTANVPPNEESSKVTPTQASGEAKKQNTRNS